MAKRNTTPEPRSPKGKYSNTRHLKVRSSYYDYQLHNQPPYKVPEPVPWLQLKGYWLKAAGFTIGTQIDVYIGTGRILLTVVSGSIKA